MEVAHSRLWAPDTVQCIRHVPVNDILLSPFKKTVSVLSTLPDDPGAPYFGPYLLQYEIFWIIA